jgi:hypothetical protein
MIRLPLPVFAPDPPPAGTPPAGTPPGNPPPADGNKPPAAPSLAAKPPGEGDPPPAAPITSMPENWRTLMAGGNPDVEKELGRFTDPAKVGDALLNYKKQMRSGSFDVPPPGEDKPEELKAWREAHGIPVEATGYKVPEEIQKRLYDEDKPILEGYIGAAHKANQPQSVIDFTTKWYVDMQEQAAAAMVERDKKGSAEAEDALRSDWGPQYRANLNAATRALAEMFPGVDLTEARLPDGTKIGNNPKVLKGMHELAVQKWGAGEFVGAEASARTQTRMQEIEKVMRENPDAYFGDPAMRKEYGDLLAADEKRKKVAG